MLALVAAAVTNAGIAPATAESTPDCKVPSFRGATSSAGASATMTLVNDGQPCSFRIFINPELRVPPDQLRLIRAPEHGTLTITQPDTVHYTPNAGFAGTDSFQYGGQGRSPGRQSGEPARHDGDHRAARSRGRAVVARAMRGRAGSAACAAMAGVALLALTSGRAQALDRCEVPPFRDALAPGGTQATMTVVNDGVACRIVNYIDSRLRLQPDAIRTITRPQYGTVRLSQPGTIFYRPSPGFIGSDEFAYAGTGRTRDGRLVEMTVRVTVTVLPRPRSRPTAPPDPGPRPALMRAKYRPSLTALRPPRILCDAVGL